MSVASLKKWLLAKRKCNDDEHVDFFGLIIAAATLVIFTFGFFVFMEQMDYVSGIFFSVDKTLPQLLWESPWKLLLFCCPPTVFWLLSKRRLCQSRLDYLLCLGGVCAVLLLMALIILVDIHYLTTEWSYFRGIKW